MVEPRKDNEEDEIIAIFLPRSKYEVLRTILEREESYNWFRNWIRSHWIFIVGSGLLTGFAVYREIFGVGIK